MTIWNNQTICGYVVWDLLFPVVGCQAYVDEVYYLKTSQIINKLLPFMTFSIIDSNFGCRLLQFATAITGSVALIFILLFLDMED